VTGDNDLPVTNLRKEDFEILENGRPQKIADFSYVSIPVANRAINIDAPPAPPSDVATNGESARATRAIVVFVDDPSLSAVMFCDFCPDVVVALRSALTRFLQTLSADDQVAIVWQSRSDISQDFTNDIPRLIASVNSRKRGLGLVAINDGPSPTLPPSGLQWRPTVESLKSVISALASSNYARRSIFYVGANACDPSERVNNMKSFESV